MLINDSLEIQLKRLTNKKPGELVIKLNQDGFSLVELMVTVAIIGVLAGMAIPNYSLSMHRTRVKLTISQMIAVRNGMIGLREIEDKTLRNITGTGCTRCQFAVVGSSASSWSLNATAISRMNSIGFSGAQTDAWGQVFLFDENEKEFADCRPDVIMSVGANGIFDGVDLHSLVVLDDDIVLPIPFKSNMPACTKYQGAYVGPTTFNLPN
ncbi:MAG: prepilin-type N-terminal cleavage/methylation domain-containing protein [Bdellovibrionota bacterium]|nr:prepilin-type N-terminal cleavage/methylation domain-containing protein [Bdellovibrionota bacterium]